MSNQDIRKVTTHISQNESLIFEHSSPGKRGLWSFRRSMSPQSMRPPSSATLCHRFR